MSTRPESAVSKTGQMFNCWSCRLISGGGLLLSSAYVAHAAQRRMRPHNGPASLGTVLQISFAACLAAWGIVIIVDPVEKARRNT